MTTLTPDQCRALAKRARDEDASMAEAIAGAIFPLQMRPATTGSLDGTQFWTWQLLHPHFGIAAAVAAINERGWPYKHATDYASVAIDHGNPARDVDGPQPYALWAAFFEVLADVLERERGERWVK